MGAELVVDIPEEGLHLGGTILIHNDTLEYGEIAWTQADQVVISIQKNFWKTCSYDLDCVAALLSFIKTKGGMVGRGFVKTEASPYAEAKQKRRTAVMGQELRQRPPLPDQIQDLRAYVATLLTQAAAFNNGVQDKPGPIVVAAFATRLDEAKTRLAQIREQADVIEGMIRLAKLAVVDSVS